MKSKLILRNGIMIMENVMEKKLEHGCLVKWRRRLEQARTRGHFTPYEVDLASTWNACAVGEARKLNSKLVVYEGILGPSDEKLNSLGSDFSELVIMCSVSFAPTKTDFNKVERCLVKIENRLERLDDLDRH
jgi:hypothetical protein